MGITPFGKLPTPPLEVLTLYEDFATGMRAASCVDRVRELCGGGTEIHLTLLRRDLLTGPEAGEEAANNGLAAQAVLLSLHGDQPLEVAIERWLIEWISQHASGPRVLAVLFDADRRGAGVVNETLSRLAVAMGQSPAELLVGFAPPLEGHPDFPLARAQRSVQPFLMPAGDSPGQLDGNSHWGLNE